MESRGEGGDQEGQLEAAEDEVVRSRRWVRRRSGEKIGCYPGRKEGAAERRRGGGGGGDDAERRSGRDCERGLTAAEDARAAGREGHAAVLGYVSRACVVCVGSEVRSIAVGPAAGTIAVGSLEVVCEAGCIGTSHD